MPDPRFVHCPDCAGGRVDCPTCDGEDIVTVVAGDGPLRVWTVDYVDRRTNERDRRIFVDPIRAHEFAARDHVMLSEPITPRTVLLGP